MDEDQATGESYWNLGELLDQLGRGVMIEGPGVFSYQLPSVWFFEVGVMDHRGFVRGAWIPPLYACLGVSINGYSGRLRCIIGYVYVFVNVIN